MPGIVVLTNPQLHHDSGHDPRILAEQVVRSGWHVPIAFELRLPKDTSLNDRNLMISARVVHVHQALFELEEQRFFDGRRLAQVCRPTLTRPKDPDR